MNELHDFMIDYLQKKTTSMGYHPQSVRPGPIYTVAQVVTAMQIWAAEHDHDLELALLKHYAAPTKKRL